MFDFQFFFALSVIIAALTHCATAQTLRTYSFNNADGCSGSYLSCDTAAGVCCNTALSTPVGYGKSLAIASLPENSIFTGYGRTFCIDNGVTVSFGPSSFVCLTSHGAWNALSVNWSLRRRAAVVDAVDTADVECASPTVFGYETDKGLIREIRIPGGVVNATETIAALYLAKDFEALDKYETYHH